MCLGSFCHSVSRARPLLSAFQALLWGSVSVIACSVSCVFTQYALVLSEHKAAARFFHYLSGLKEIESYVLDWWVHTRSEKLKHANSAPLWTDNRAACFLFYTIRWPDHWRLLHTAQRQWVAYCASLSPVVGFA